MPPLSSPTFLAHHEFDIRTLVRFVPFSRFFRSFLLCSIPFSSNNSDNAVSFPPYNKPFLRIRSLSITQKGSHKKKNLTRELAEELDSLDMMLSSLVEVLERKGILTENEWEKQIKANIKKNIKKAKYRDIQFAE